MMCINGGICNIRGWHKNVVFTNLSIILIQSTKVSKGIFSGNWKTDEKIRIQK